MTNETSGVPGSQAHQARLRQILDQETQRIRERAAVPDLIPEHQERLDQIIQDVLIRPRMSMAEVLEILEALIGDPELGPRTVYQYIDDLRSLAMHEVAVQAFLAGMTETGATAGDQPGGSSTAQET